MKTSMAAAAIAAGILTVAAPVAQANSISEVEGARAKDRQGGYLTRQEREKLRRYGGNDDGYYGYRSGGYDYGYGGYYGGPGVRVYVNPPPYYYGYGPYGY